MAHLVYFLKTARLTQHHDYHRAFRDRLPSTCTSLIRIINSRNNSSISMVNCNHFWLDIQLTGMRRCCILSGPCTQKKYPDISRSRSCHVRAHAQNRKKMAEDVFPHKNPISRLQEVCQQRKFPLPTYREAQGTFSEFGTEVSLTLEGEAVTFYGRARTKKTSKSCAAQEVLDYISQTKPHLLEPPPIAVRWQLKFILYNGNVCPLFVTYDLRCFLSGQVVDESAIVEAQGIWKKGMCDCTGKLLLIYFPLVLPYPPFPPYFPYCTRVCAL